jgi:formiminoglutamase
MTPDWLTLRRSDAPLILTMPHGGTDIPADIMDQFVSPWLARCDTDWHIAELYNGLVDATIIATSVSRSVIDVNRDPSGASLYPGQATTELCPTTTFDGEPLYAGNGPDAQEIARRREVYFDPYHAVLSAEVARLRSLHPHVIIYDCHSIRSRVPRLFDGDLPEFNIGTNGGVTCAPALRAAVLSAATVWGRSIVLDGRFRGGWTTRHYGRPVEGLHAVQMELALRAYLSEPAGALTPDNWPPAYDPDHAAPLRVALSNILSTCLEFTL